MIKDLKTSTILSAAVKSESKRKDGKDRRRHRDKRTSNRDGDSSSLSLSDEETYERERNRFYVRKDEESHSSRRFDDFRTSYRQDRLSRRSADRMR